MTDTERLNWLEKEWAAGRLAIVNPGPLTHVVQFTAPRVPLRAAVDDAMAISARQLGVLFRQI